ncbi:MAG: VWA domain-containing protein, partial [Desulfatiglandales bacterium]|nr:VWA domain-containing protein [Desulfatiglandales bacterium]
MKTGPNIYSRLKRMNDQSLTRKVILFSCFLKNRGFNVFSSNIIDSLQGLEEIDISKREDFCSALRTNLVTTDMEWTLFDELFEEFWQGIDSPEVEESEGPEEEGECQGDSVMELLPESAPDNKSERGNVPEQEETEMATYSPVSRLEGKNLAQVQNEDIRIAQLILKNMISPVRIAEMRRFRKSKSPGAMDFRRIMKKSLKAGGIPLELAYKKKKKRLKRLVILADVSGSMGRYARFVMPFI